MEQRKKELVSNCGKLENECQATYNLLKELLDKNSRAINDIHNLTNNDLLKNPDQFLKASKQIYNAIHKVMGINLDLENFIMSDENCDTSSINKCKNESTAEISIENNNVDGNSNEPLHVVNPMSDGFDQKNDSSSDGTNTQTGSELSTSNTYSNSSEETGVYKQKPLAIQKLMMYKPKSRKDKYIESLPKACMPDLKFKRCQTTSSTDYKSFSNGSSNNVKKSDVSQKFETCTDSSEPPNVIVLNESPTPNINDLCVLSSYVSPSEFYINICNEDTALLESLDSKLTEYGNKSNYKFKSKEYAKAYVTKYCLVYRKDWEQWYRAEVTNWLDDSTMDIVIQLLDYGEYTTVTFKDILVLPQSFCIYPKLAIRCHFAYLYPPGSTEASLKTEWPSESLSVLSKAIENYENVYRLVFIDQNEKSLAVDIIHTEECNEEKTLGQIMIDLGHAVQILPVTNKLIKNSFIKEQLKTAQGMAGINDTMSPEEQLEKFYNNIQIEEPATISEALTMYDAQDEARTCRFARKDETCFKGPSCKLDHKQLRNDGYTTDKKVMYTNAFVELPIPKTGDVLEMIITFVCSINQFYAQIRNYDPNGEKLKQLLNQMNQSKMVANYKSYKILPALGELVLAQYLDKKWYRAMVREIATDPSNPDIVVQVFFVDFGDVMDVQLKDIREMKPEYLHLPFQAVRCSITNIEQKENMNAKEAKEYFETRYLCQNVHATVVYSGASFLDVFISTNDSFDIGLQLIEEGFAVFRKDFLPKSNKVLLVD